MNAPRAVLVVAGASVAGFLTALTIAGIRVAVNPEDYIAMLSMVLFLGTCAVVGFVLLWQMFDG